MVPISDVQLLEGMVDHAAKCGKKPNIVDLIADWRAKASKFGMASPQLYLASSGYPLRPVSDHVVTNSLAVLKLLVRDRH